MNDSHEVTATADSPRLQFRLSTIFVLTLIASVLSAFLRPRGEALIPAGLINVGVIAIVALIVGLTRGGLPERIFWGSAVTAMMQAVSAEVILLDPTGIYGWPITAGIAAIFAAAPDGLYRRMIRGGLAAGLSMIAYSASLDAPAHALAMNIVSATIGGALLGVLIEFCQWLEKERQFPQSAIGLLLVLSAIGFAVVAPRVIPGW